MTDSQTDKAPMDGEKLDDKYAGYFGPFRAVVFDGYCGEPIGWGYAPNTRLGDALFKEVETSLKGARWHCLDLGHWVVATRHLTPKMAVEKYGPITKMYVGPRGGYKSVTYGDKIFCSKQLDPRNVLAIDPSLIVTMR